MSPNNIRKESAPKEREPLPADYNDEVTDKHLEKIDELAGDIDLKDAEVVSGPAW